MSEKNSRYDQLHRELEDQRCAVNDDLSLLIPVVYGIAETFGSNCEVVLHDFQQPETSIAVIAGNVTNRHVGGSMTELGLSIIAQGDDAQDQVNYITRTLDGRVLKSTTIVLRNYESRVIGALCINLDVTELRGLANIIGELAGPPLESPQPVTFGDDIGQVIQAIIEEEKETLRDSTYHLTKQERLTITRSLDRRGIFTLQNAVPRVAECLGISRATVYTYLEEIRNTKEK